jgi:hypothetical protein
MTATLTLADIRAHSPCAHGWRQLLATLGTDDLSTRVSIGDIALSNGAPDALWCLHCLPNTVDVRRVAVAMILPAVRRAAAHTTDQRVHDCIATVERWQAGVDSADLWAAAAAAWAAWAAAWAAGAAAAREAGAAEAERAQQVADIIAVSPLLALAEEVTP